MSNAPINKPAIAGPTIRDALKTAALSPTALVTSSRPTISTANACRVGMSIAFVVPRSAASTMTCQTSTTPVTVRPNRANARIIDTVCVASSVLRFGSWSAMTPPNRPNTMIGPNWATATRPSQSGSCVSWRMSQAWATCCIHVPTRETSCPVKNSR